MCPMYDFKCVKCNDTFEKLASYDTAAITCDCGGMMQRQISLPNIVLDGTDPSLPGAYDKWARDHERRAEQNKKKSYYEG